MKKLITTTLFLLSFSSFASTLKVALYKQVGDITGFCPIHNLSISPNSRTKLYNRPSGVVEINLSSSTRSLYLKDMSKNQSACSIVIERADGSSIHTSWQGARQLRIDL